MQFFQGKGGISGDGVPSNVKTINFGQKHCVGKISFLSASGAPVYNGVAGDVFAFGIVPVPPEARVHLHCSIEGACDLSPLENLEPDDLEYIGLERCEMEDFQLKHMIHLSSLKSLNLHGTYLSEFGFAFVGALRRLQSLNLGNSRIADPAMAKLASMNLETLNLGGTCVSDAGLALIANMSSLQHLILPDGITDDGMKAIAGMNLKTLTLAETKVTDTGLAHVGNMRSLEILTLPPAATDAGLTALFNLHLEILYVGASKCTKEGLAEVRASGIAEFTI